MSRRFLAVWSTAAVLLIMIAPAASAENLLDRSATAPLGSPLRLVDGALGEASRAVGSPVLPRDLSARVEPAYAEPGSVVLLILASGSGGVLDVGVAERVTCTVTSPAGVTSRPCSGHGSLLRANVLEGGERQWIFEHVAGSEPGVHSISFILAEGTLAQSRTLARATFDVLAPGTSAPGSGSGGSEGSDRGNPSSSGASTTAGWTTPADILHRIAAALSTPDGKRVLLAGGLAFIVLVVVALLARDPKGVAS